MRKTQAERRALTRAALIGAGRRLFGAKGYAATGTEEIVAEAQVTRGALYHHFRDKQALFLAVAEEVFVDVLAEIERAALQERDPATALRAGCRAWLAASLKKEPRRILLIDAPAVIGWHAWRALDVRYGMGSLREGLRAAADAARTPLRDLDAATHLLSGALNEAALLLAAKPRDAKLREAVETTLDALLGGLFSTAAQR